MMYLGRFWFHWAFLTLVAGPLAHADTGFDLLVLKNGSQLQGCLQAPDGSSVSIETLAGVLQIPVSQVKSMHQTDPGASELKMGVELLERKQFGRAESYLRQAARHSGFYDPAQQALEKLKQQRAALEAEKREAEKREIERIIQRQGLQAGIEAIKKRQQAEKEYWGNMRGKLHLAIARERLDHLDLHRAEKHLVLASEYGCDPEAWETVRAELVEMRRKRIRFGEDYLAKLHPPQEEQQQYQGRRVSNFLDAIALAREEGEKLPPVELLKHVDAYAAENGLDPLLVWAMIDVESSWRVQVVSHKGAQGLMQLMPSTASDLDVANVFDPAQNIRGGTRYMRFLLEMFGDLDTALAAYNVGPGRVERMGRIPEAGHRYIKKVKERLARVEERLGPYLTRS